MAIFHSRYDHVERGKGLFQLEPKAAPASRCVQRIRRLGDDSLVSGSESIAKSFFERFARLAHAFWRELKMFRLGRCQKPFQSTAPFGKRRIQQEFPVEI